LCTHLYIVEAVSVLNDFCLCTNVIHDHNTGCDENLRLSSISTSFTYRSLKLHGCLLLNRWLVGYMSYFHIKYQYKTFLSPPCRAGPGARAPSLNTPLNTYSLVQLNTAYIYSGILSGGILSGSLRLCVCCGISMSMILSLRVVNFPKIRRNALRAKFSKLHSIR